MPRLANERTNKKTLLCSVTLSIFEVIVCALGQTIGAASADKPTAITAQADFFVSPRGNDNRSGRLADPAENNGPFATITRARDAVRPLVKAQKPPEGIRVVVRGGTYYLDSPIEFGPEDSGRTNAPVAYAAAMGEKVVLSGGRRLEGGRWSQVNGCKAWVVDIQQVAEGQWRFRQLFVNGVRRPRTRLPKQGEYRIESLPGYTGDFLRSPTNQFVYAPGDIVPAWRNLRDVEIVAITRWLDNRLPLESVNAQTRTGTFDRSSLFALLSGNKPGPYWVENVLEALDTPGQWCLDRPSGQLYYLPQPGEDPTSADLFYSGISVGSVQDFGPNHAQGNIVEFNHIHDIGQGMLSDLAGIYTCSTPGTRIRYNLVHDVSRREYGGWGIYPDEGSHDLLIEKNLVFRCQDGALFAHHNRNITAENNTFAFNRVSQVDRGGIGGFELTCRRNLICSEQAKAIGDYGIGNCGRDVCAFDHNLYWNAAGKPILFGTKNLSEWQALGQDKNSLIVDPLFVDPAHGNFSLRPGSPAEKIGFEPWDMSAIGPRPASMTLRKIRSGE